MTLVTTPRRQALAWTWLRPRRRFAHLARAAAPAVPIEAGIGAGPALPAPFSAVFSAGPQIWGEMRRRGRAVLLRWYARCHGCGQRLPALRSLTCALAQRRRHMARCPGQRVTAATERRRRCSGRLVHVLGEVALTLAALLGLAGIALTAIAARADIRPLVVRSGSMAPTVPVGSMVLVQRVPADELRPGHVVAVDRPDGARVMHRIVAIDRSGPTPTLTLKGDANDDPDPMPVPVVDAERLRWHAREVGRAAAWLATAPGGFALGCLATGLTIATLRGRYFAREG